MTKKYILFICFSLIFITSPRHESKAETLDQFKTDVTDLTFFLRSITPILPSGYAPQIEGKIDLRESGKDQYTLDIANLYLVPINQAQAGQSKRKIRLGQFSLTYQKHPNQKGFHFKALLPGLMNLLDEHNVPVGEIHIHQGLIEGDWDYGQRASTNLSFSARSFDITDAVKTPILETKGLSISEKKDSLNPTSIKSSLVYEVQNLHHHETKSLPTIKIDHFKIISRSEGMSKEHFQSIFEIITYLSLLKPIGLYEWTPEETQFHHNNLERLEPSINGLHLQVSLKNLSTHHQTQQYDLKIENLEQNLDLQNLDQDQFGVLFGFRLDNPHLLKPAISKNILPDVFLFNITGEKIPQTAFWTAIRQFLIDSHLPGAKVNLDWSLPPFVKAMKQSGSKFRLNRALYENKTFKVSGQGLFTFTPLAIRDMTADAHFTVKDIDSFIHQLTTTQIQNPNFGLFSTILTLKLLREIGIPQEGVRKPSERKYDFTLDEAGNMKLNHFDFSGKKTKGK